MSASKTLALLRSVSGRVASLGLRTITSEAAELRKSETSALPAFSELCLKRNCQFLLRVDGDF